MKLTLDVVKKIGTELNINFDKISVESLFDGIKSEEEHYDLLPSKHTHSFDINDYKFFATIAKTHLVESPKYYEELFKMEKLLKINEDKVLNAISLLLEDNNFYHNLKHIVNKDDAGYNRCYNKALGKYKIKSPEYLEDSDKNEFYEYLDTLLKDTQSKKDELNPEKELYYTENEIPKDNIEEDVESNNNLKNIKSDEYNIPIDTDNESFDIGEIEIEEDEEDVDVTEVYDQSTELIDKKRYKNITMSGQYSQGSDVVSGQREKLDKKA